MFWFVVVFVWLGWVFGDGLWCLVGWLCVFLWIDVSVVVFGYCAMLIRGLVRLLNWWFGWFGV